MSTLVTGNATSQMVKVPTSIWMARITRVIGLRISIMELEKSIGQMVPSTKVPTKRERSTVRVTFHGKMDQISKVHSSIIAWKVKVLMNGTI